ncbi:MAG: alpha/beta hydrolase [Ilumatobacteraceae bacterium]
MSERIEVGPGVEIAYERQGSGPSLVLVHGITESRHTWDPLVPALARDHDVIAVDLRGHGESSMTPPYDSVVFAADLAALLGTLGVEMPLLVGHSLGGVVVSVMATMLPVRGVVNVDQPLRLSGFQEGVRMLEPALRGTIEEFEGAIAAMFSMMDGALPGEERERIQAGSRPEQDVVLGIWDGVLTATPEELDALVAGIAQGISVPYLALHGIDPGPDYAPWLESLCATASVEVWADLGHYPHLVQPERFLARVARFEDELG